jgi:hypothetical protein
LRILRRHTVDEGLGIREEDKGRDNTDNRRASGICFWKDG